MKTMMLSVSAAVVLGRIAGASAIDVSDWDALKTGVATDGVAEITVGADIAANSNLDTSKTSGSGTPVSRDLTVSGASSSSAPTVSGGGNNMYLRVGDGATLTLKDIAFSDFKHYQATDRNSVFASHQGGNLVLDNAKLSGISNDDAQPMWGAVVSVSDKSQASIVNSVFENNNQKTSNEGVDAATGGVIHLQGQTSRHDLSKLNVLSGSTFGGNSMTATKTDAFGGAAYLEGWVGSMENNRFIGNAAKTESNVKNAFGGAVSVGGANVGRGAATIESIVGGVFKDNTAASEKGKSYGGAIYVSADGVINNISGVEFSGNTADFGGAIYNAGNIVRMADSTFDATDDVENASGGTIGSISGIQMKGTLTNGGTIAAIDGVNGIAGLVNSGVIGQIDGTNVVGNLQNTGTGSITVNSGDFSVTGTFFNDANASIANNGAINVSGDAVNNGSITGNSIRFGGGSLTNNGSLVGVAAGSVIANLTNTKEIGVISDTEVSGAFVNAESATATVEKRFGGASAVVENSGVLNFDAADFTGTLNNYRRFNLTGENTLTGAFVNSGETTVAAGARVSFSGGIENSRSIVNNGVLIVEGGNSFNGGTITGGVRFDGDASLENDGTIDSIEDSRFANSRGAALLNNGKIDRLSNVTVDGLFENASGAVFVENSLTATRTINDASLDFGGVVYTGALLNRSRLSTTGDNTVAGGVLKNAGLLSVGAGSLTLAGGLENASVILNSGVLTAAGTSVNNGFISGDIVVGDGSASNFVNNGYVMGKTTIAANAEMTSSLDTLNGVDIAAGGVLNVAGDGILRHDVTGAGEMIVSRNLYMGTGSLSATGVFTVTGGGMADIGDRTVTVGTLRLNGTLNVDVASIAAGSSVYAGGKVVVNDGAEIGADSVLKISIAAGMLQKGERTGELKIVDGNNVSGAFGNILSNNRYAIAAGGADGTIVVVGTASAEDVAGTTGNRNNRNAAAAWDSAVVAADTAAGAVKSILNDASQFDTARYARNLTLVAPTDSNLALMTARELNDRISRGVRNRLNAGRRPSAWAESFGDYARQDGNFDGVGFNARTAGFMFGADGEVDDGVSVGAGYVFSRTDADFGGRDTDIGGHAVFAYAEYSPDAFFVRGGLSYNYAEYKEKATVENIAVSSDYDIWTLGAEAAAGYRFANGVVPEAELRYTYLMPENYTDSLGQSVHQNNARMLTAAAVFHVRPDYGGAGVRLRPTADLGVSYDLMEPRRKAGVSIGGAGYEIRNRKMPRLGAEGGVGVDFAVGGWDFSAGYDFSVREDYRSHAGKLKVRRDF